MFHVQRSACFYQSCGSDFETIALQDINYFAWEEVELQQSYTIGRHVAWLTTGATSTYSSLQYSNVSS